MRPRHEPATSNSRPKVSNRRHELAVKFMFNSPEKCAWVERNLARPSHLPRVPDMTYYDLISRYRHVFPETEGHKEPTDLHFRSFMRLLKIKPMFWKLWFPRKHILETLDFERTSHGLTSSHNQNKTGSYKQKHDLDIMAQLPKFPDHVTWDEGMESRWTDGKLWSEVMKDEYPDYVQRHAPLSKR